LLASVAVQSPDIVTVDMSGSLFCDSAGLNALTRVRRQLRASGSELRVVLGNSPVRRIFQLSGIDRVVEVFDNLEQSLASERSSQERKHP
jgi:anti-sigma B factor antagonist